MADLVLSSDAFSHGQIRSKLWLSGCFEKWSNKHLPATPFALHWYGSWVGIGPFLLLSLSRKSFRSVSLYDTDEKALASSVKVLDYWRCESVEINTVNADVNRHKPEAGTHQLFVNTSCEHMEGDAWLQNLPTGAAVLLQSTDMPHAEHINKVASLADFRKKCEASVHILESDEIRFSYPDKKFSRFMIFGTKR